MEVYKIEMNGGYEYLESMYDVECAVGAVQSSDEVEGVCPVCGSPHRDGDTFYETYLLPNGDRICLEESCLMEYFGITHEWVRDIEAEREEYELRSELDRERL